MLTGTTVAVLSCLSRDGRKKRCPNTMSHSTGPQVRGGLVQTRSNLLRVRPPIRGRPRLHRDRPNQSPTLPRSIGLCQPCHVIHPAGQRARGTPRHWPGSGTGVRPTNAVMDHRHVERPAIAILRQTEGYGYVCLSLNFSYNRVKALPHGIANCLPECLGLRILRAPGGGKSLKIG